MNTNTLIAPVSTARQKFRIFTLYADFSAGVRAKRLAEKITLAIGPRFPSVANMWTLNSVGPIGDIGEMIAQEAGESDVLLVASSSAQRPEPGISAWLTSLVNWKANRLAPGLLIGLLGDGETELAEESWLFQELAGFARKTRMDLAWQWVGPNASPDFGSLTPHIEKLLATRESGLPGTFTAAD